MTSTELKHQARLQEWAVAIQDCRSSGLSVRQWCRERGTTPTTYYRWERELLSIAGSTATLPETPAVAFAELPVPKQVCCNTAERSATLHLDNVTEAGEPMDFINALRLVESEASYRVADDTETDNLMFMVDADVSERFTTEALPF